MKKFLLTICLVASLLMAVNAQPRAVGGRVGWNLEASYQHSFATYKYMIDLTAGVTNFFTHWWYSDLNCVFDWVFNISSGWNWYVGPGLGFGYGFGKYWHTEQYLREYHGTPWRFNLGFQIGVEYQFDIPLNLSIDWRPMWNVLGFGRPGPFFNEYYGDFFNLGIGVRYRF